MPLTSSNSRGSATFVVAGSTTSSARHIDIRKQNDIFLWKISQESDAKFLLIQVKNVNLCQNMFDKYGNKKAKKR